MHNIKMIPFCNADLFIFIFIPLRITIGVFWLFGYHWGRGFWLFPLPNFYPARLKKARKLRPQPAAGKIRLHIEPFSLRISFSVKYVRMWMFYIKTSNRFLYILLFIRMYCFAKRVLLQQHHLLLWICVVFHKQKHIF